MWALHSFLVLLVGVSRLCSAELEQNAALAALRGGVGKEQYTTNAACLQNHCINPVIPGLMFLGESVLEKNMQKKWVCAGIQNTKSLFKLGGFCSRIIVAYPFMIPKPDPPVGTTTASPTTTVAADDGAAATTTAAPPTQTPMFANTTEAGLIQQQTYRALETYVGHLANMGFDFWDHTEPWSEEDECIKSVWKMSCYTYFPRCNEISEGTYLPPCASSCRSYLKKCAVQCCDEGNQCVFTHAKETADGKVAYEHGYPDHIGPSPLCTGGASQPMSTVVAAFLALLMAIQH